MIGGKLCYPATNYRSCEVLETTPDKVVFALHYPEWEAAEGIRVSLDKKVTICADSYFGQVEDVYTFTGTDTLAIAAGIKRHGAQQTIVEECCESDRYAIWEHASDQSVEPEDGMLGVAIVLPGAEDVIVSEELDHGLLIRRITSGQPVAYSFGSCWSKADLKTSADWFALVKAQ